jgi:hypothetical protein
VLGAMPAFERIEQPRGDENVLRSSLTALGLAALALLVGCASPGGGSAAAGADVTASDTARLTRSGFLSDYARLKRAPVGDGAECWRAADVDLRKYDKVMISRIVVSLKPSAGGEQTVDPSDLKTLTDYFHASLAKSLSPQMQVVDKAGPGVVVIRIALTDLVPTGVTRSIAGTLIPYGFVAEAGSGVATGRPAGSTPYLGETGVEIQFRDGASGAILGECRDTQIGRKYAADINASATGAAETWVSGYLNSFQSWAYAKDAFDKWSGLIAKRFAELRAAAS